MSADLHLEQMPRRRAYGAKEGPETANAFVAEVATSIAAATIDKDGHLQNAIQSAVIRRPQAWIGFTPILEALDGPALKAATRWRVRHRPAPVLEFDYPPPLGGPPG